MWGFLPKLAVRYLDSKSVLIYQVIGTVIVGIIIWFFLGFGPQIHFKGAILAILTGVVGTLGALFFLIAISKEKASVVVTITALYPVVTLALAFLVLKESITFKQGVGIILALIAMALLST